MMHLFHDWRIVDYSHVQINSDFGDVTNYTRFLYRCTKCDRVKSQTVKGTFNIPLEANHPTMSTPKELRKKLPGWLAEHVDPQLIPDLLALIDAESRARSVEEMEKVQAEVDRWYDDGLTPEINDAFDQAISRLTDGHE